VRAPARDWASVKPGGLGTELLNPARLVGGTGWDSSLSGGGSADGRSAGA